jgi:hypothetical protein
MQVSGLPPAVVDNSVTVVFQHVGGQP